MKNSNSSRRDFLRKSAITSGIAAFSPFSFTENLSPYAKVEAKLPREVWIAGISQAGLRAPNSREMADKFIEIVNESSYYCPDIVCLPETFTFFNIEKEYSLSERLKISEEILPVFSGLAKKFNCYLICPVYTSEGKKAYNAAVVHDRNGNKMGEYRKMHLSQDDLNLGLTPGPLDPPVFQTDFGKIGIQICFDIVWDDGWSRLKEQGAEIVFWPSAFAGGKMVNAKAWQHKYVVVSATAKDTSKICDITGEVVVQTGTWDSNWFYAPVNLEKTFLPTWPYVEHFGEIRKKYGRKVRITTFHEEEWSIIESLSPEVFVSDILKEFKLKTHEQLIYDTEKEQIRARNT